MKNINIGKNFKKYVVKCEKRGWDMEKLKTVITLLATGATLEEKYKNHKLEPKSKGVWDLHIEPDWVLLYTVTEDEVTLIATGTHSDLF